MFKFIVAAIYAVLAVILCFPYHFYLKSQIKKNHMTGWTKAWKFVRSFFKGLIAISGSRVEVRGAEKLPENQAILYVGNHRSYFDIIILQTITPGPIGFVAKKEFSKVPLFYNYMEDIGCLFLDRSNVREGLKTINEATEYMKEGLSMSLFPEGTRNHSDELLPFKPGGYRIAEKSESPIVVAAFTGFDDILENNKPFGLKKRHVIIEFSDPVYPHKLDKQAKKDFYDSIPDQINEMRKGHTTL